MQIEIKRQGGFAGIDEHIGSLNTQGMNDSEVDAVNEYLSKLGEEKDEAEGADMYIYQITIRAAGEEERVLFVNGGGDPGQPDNDALRGLCQLISSDN